jgi:hypothetical protein
MCASVIPASVPDLAGHFPESIFIGKLEYFRFAEEAVKIGVELMILDGYFEDVQGARRSIPEQCSTA